MFATAGDVMSVVGPDVAADPEWVAALVGRAERMLLAQVPSILARADAGLIDLDLVRDIIAAAAARVVRNPQGIRQEMAGSYLYMLDSSISSGSLAFTPEELALLRSGSTATPSKPLRIGVPCWRVI